MTGVNSARNWLQKEQPKVSDDNNGMPSVFEYDEDVGEAKAPKPLPKAKYRASIEGVEAKVSEKSGNQYAAVSFKIAPDQYPADFTDGNPDGTIIVYRRITMEKEPRAVYRLRKFLEAIGAPKGKTINLSDWLGREAIIKLDHQKGNDGLDYPDIVEILPAS
jgi:hypothetical protein